LSYRINHFLSKSGVCSRRAADRLVRQGRVRVNQQPALLGMKVAAEDDVRLDGQPVVLVENQYFYRLYYKPRGVVCTQNLAVDGNLLTAIKPMQTSTWPNYFFAVGRLDKDSEGALLLTNNGTLTNCLLNENKTLPKRYLVTVTPQVTDEFLEKMSAGVEILDQVTEPCRVFRLSEQIIQIELTQGLNRQIRRMCQALGYQVQRLIRIEFAGLGINHLPAGNIRSLCANEIAKIESLSKNKP